MGNRITPHFHVSEFTKRDPKIITPIQWFMLQYLCNNLEVMREFLSNEFGQTISIKVTNGIRMPSDNNALRKKGYNPSETSDHLFGNMVKLRSNAKIKQFGRYYNYSVGASDIIPACGAKEAYMRMKPFLTRGTGEISLPNGRIKVGQMILEKRNGYWIHISNPPELIYSKNLADSFLDKIHFLQSTDNGRTYEKV